MQEAAIPINDESIGVTLQVPAGALSLVIFAHGSGSSRFSRRNRFVAGVLNAHGFGTLLVDLLTRSEDEIDQRTAQHRFDIELLASRLSTAARWAQKQELTAHLPLGFFGASTGAAAALRAAAEMPQETFAVVSRGGRPDLAGEALAHVHAPVLLLVGEADPVVLNLNRAAYLEIHSAKQLIIIPGATHLFEEPGALESVAEHAATWFASHVPAQGRR